MMSPDPSDTKATIPVATAYRGQTLTDRPNRLVMLVGPTPGVEYPLDRERMTIGRAEDASISVNHNSVSRLHCEVHALGDGRFEIVDKGSSNGVRVNAVELRRSIVEPGDVIELGDVRFKFVGAGQVFVPGPNESQQLTAISDREVDLVVNQKKGLGAYALPVIGALVIGGGVLIAALIYTRHNQTLDPGADASITSASDTDAQIIADAKAKCLPSDCDSSRIAIQGIADSSPWQSSADYKFIVATWADSILAKARAEQDPANRNAMLQRVAADPKVDAARKAQATALMQSGDNTQPQPSNTAPVPTDTTMPSATVALPTPTNVTPPATTHPNHPPNPGTAAPPTTTAKPTGPNVDDLARAAALRGDPQAVRGYLEQKVRSGKGTPEEANMVKQACKAQQDRACTDDIKTKYQNL
jgi:pSer/pThr/pTyr-binding forkhead associated (FHA) protein